MVGHATLDGLLKLTFFFFFVVSSLTDLAFPNQTYASLPTYIYLLKEIIL